MRKCLIILLLLLASCGKREDLVPEVPVPGGPDYVFSSTFTPEIHLEVKQEQWNALLAAFDKNSATQEYVRCNMTFKCGNEVESFRDVGLRLKGNTSRRRPYSGGKYHHVHFGLNLDRFDEKQHLRGVKRMDLKWFKDDPSYVREMYCYDLFRRVGVWTAVRDTYSRLWLKVGDGPEIYYGVYNLMEHIGNGYLKDRRKEFGGTDGFLWKCTGGASLSNVNASMGADDDVHYYTYELKSGDDFKAAEALLKDFIKNLNSLSGTEFSNWISTHMDVPFLLKTYAVNVAVGMWDDYWNNANNYYLYFSNTVPYKVWFIPYDYDNTLGTSLACGVQTDAGRQDPYKWGSSGNPLMSKILRSNTWKILYKAELQALCGEGGEFAYPASVSRISLWQALIQPYVDNDTGEDTRIDDRPASWGNQGRYRLLKDGPDNFFRVKSEVVAAMQ